jgi:hypothetical protein
MSASRFRSRRSDHPDHPLGREKTLSAISNEMKDLGKRAKDRKLKPEEYQGGTTAVSNMGMMGVKDFAAVVNPPHATILAVGAGEQRAGRQGWRTGGGNRDDCDAVDRSSLPSMARWAPNCLQPSRATSKIRWGCWSDPGAMVMKTVLCFGDSLTWGYDAESRARHALEDRWSSTLAAALGDGVHVVADGLNGRTTAFDDLTGDCDRNGAAFCPPCCMPMHRWIW